jgi:hypothetical protein
MSPSIFVFIDKAVSLDESRETKKNFQTQDHCATQTVLCNATNGVNCKIWLHRLTHNFPDPWRGPERLIERPTMRWRRQGYETACYSASDEMIIPPRKDRLVMRGK